MVVRYGLKKINEIADYMQKVLVKKGFSVEHNFSGISKSEYLKVSKEDDDNVSFDIRISDHELPLAYGRNPYNFDIEGDGVSRGGTHFYVDVLEYIISEEMKKSKRALEQEARELERELELKARDQIRMQQEKEWEEQKASFLETSEDEEVLKIKNLLEQKTEYGANVVTGNARRKLKQKLNKIIKADVESQK